MDHTISQLFDCNCISNGIFSLKSGNISRFYYNLKNLISYPKLLCEISEKVYSSINQDFDIICGIPHGGMPIATYISIKYNKPMILVRDKQKSYGMNNLIEGEYDSSSRCVIIDDVITSGGSIKEVYSILENQVNIVNISVVIDRQMHNGLHFQYNSLINKNDITRYLLDKYISDKKSNLCFSADISDPNKLLDILNNIGDYIVICKLHVDIIQTDLCPDFLQKLMELANNKSFLLMEDRKFVDISYIVEKQYNSFKNWADLVTVHGSVNPGVVRYLSGVLLVANMSNNTFNFNDKCIDICEEYNDRVIGFITQDKIDCNNKICMTPGISHIHTNVDDQKYKTIDDISTDIAIIGRAIYNSDDPKKVVLSLLKYIDE